MNYGSIIFRSQEFSPSLGPTQRPIEWLPVVRSPGVNRRGLKLTIYLLRVPSFRMSGYVSLLSHPPSQRAQGNIYPNI
jgi:hypothetical protein